MRVPKVQKFHSIMLVSRWPTWLWTWSGLHTGLPFLLSSLCRTVVSHSPQDGSLCTLEVASGVEVHELIYVSHTLLKKPSSKQCDEVKLYITHQHHRGSLEAQYLAASSHMGKGYQLLEELNYCVEFFGHWTASRSPMNDNLLVCPEID